MDDPVQRHPTRAEQLDILVTLAAERTRPGDAVLDLGCGAGYVAHLLLGRRPDLRLTGIDRSAEALARAAAALAAHDGRVTLVEGDLAAPDSLDLAETRFAVILSALTFHDLADPAKRRVIAWAARRLAPGGAFYLYDRLRLTAPELFPLQQALWRRIERLHGTAMRSAASWADYLDDLGPDNRPASLDDYRAWFAEAGLAFAPLHLHGNVGLLAGAVAEPRA